jgi:hypothetical protein
MCNGDAIPSGTFSDDLKALLGTSTTPDLRAMFLRGAGTGNLRTGPTVKTIQPEDLKAHLHKVEINTNTTGNHTHTVSFSNDDYSGGGGGDTGLEDDRPNNFNRSLTSSSSGAHAHNVNGDTGSTGGTETRPINYGVNYIIKL